LKQQKNKVKVSNSLQKENTSKSEQFFAKRKHHLQKG